MKLHPDLAALHLQACLSDFEKFKQKMADREAALQRAASQQAADATDKFTKLNERLCEALGQVNCLRSEAAQSRSSAQAQLDQVAHTTSIRPHTLPLPARWALHSTWDICVPWRPLVLGRIVMQKLQAAVPPTWRMLTGYAACRQSKRPKKLFKQATTGSTPCCTSA
jgi:hypothetical protein